MIAMQAHGPYSSYQGSPVSKGQLQPDMWGVTPSDRWDWAGLRANIAQYGIRNSLLLAPMPTASTAQVRVTSSLSDPYLVPMQSLFIPYSIPI